MKKNIRKGIYALDLLIVSVCVGLMWGTFYRWYVVIPLFYPLLLRLNISLLLYRREKRTGWCILAFTVWVLFFADGYSAFMAFMKELATMLFLKRPSLNPTIWGYVKDPLEQLVWLYLCLVPLVAYAVLWFRKELTDNHYTWKDLAGLRLFKDPAGKLLVALAGIMLLAYTSGLYTIRGISALALFTLPALTYAAFNRYLGRKAHWTEYLLIVMAMDKYYDAQFYTGTMRLGLLALSGALVLAAYLWMYVKTRRAALLFSAFVITALAVPLLSLGYNIYAGLDGSNEALYTDKYISRGVFITSGSKKIGNGYFTVYGLRDRYGTLLPPVYDDITVEDWEHHIVKLTFDGGRDYCLVNIKKLEPKDVERTKPVPEEVRSVESLDINIEAFEDSIYKALAPDTGRAVNMRILDHSAFEYRLMHDVSSFTHPFSRLRDIRYITMKETTDGRLRYYEWSKDYGSKVGWTNEAIYQFQGADGIFYSDIAFYNLLTEEERELFDMQYGLDVYYTQLEHLYTFEQADGNAVYVADFYGYAGTQIQCQVIVAFSIEGNRLVSRRVFETDKGLAPILFFEHDGLPVWETFARNVSLYDWVDSLDEQNNDLYLSNSGSLSDRYLKYHFDGEVFRLTDRDAGGFWLYPSLQDYEELRLLLETDDYLVRVDKLEDDSYRYASWKNGHDVLDMSEEPDLVLYGDEYSVGTETYFFYSEGYTYMVGKIEQDNSEYGTFLIIQKGDVILLEQRSIW